ncbi:hypothetical protein TH1_11005 [Thalassospira lucentensis MCCC 1A00383 = DSM 14000]|nr:hypothetical protein TH1_11005 [Thalassospira lucentensis MCCC 1A00383 = DSM 14000]
MCIWMQADGKGGVRQDKTMAPSRCLDALKSLSAHLFFMFRDSAKAGEDGAIFRANPWKPLS